MAPWARNTSRCLIPTVANHVDPSTSASVAAKAFSKGSKRDVWVSDDAGDLVFTWDALMAEQCHRLYFCDDALSEPPRNYSQQSY